MSVDRERWGWLADEGFQCMASVVEEGGGGVEVGGWGVGGGSLYPNYTQFLDGEGRGEEGKLSGKELRSQQPAQPRMFAQLDSARPAPGLRACTTPRATHSCNLKATHTHTHSEHGLGEASVRTNAVPTQPHSPAWKSCLF